jgi:hypothetical protein
VAHAFEIDLIDVVFRNAYPFQQASCLKSNIAAQDKTCSIASVEAVITPARIRHFDTATSTSIRCVAIVNATGCVEGNPTRTGLFSFAR